MTDHHRHDRKWLAATLPLLLAAPLAAEWPQDSSPHKSGFVTANGVRLHYLDWGGASPATLILIHGLGDNPHLLRRPRACAHQPFPRHRLCPPGTRPV